MPIENPNFYVFTAKNDGESILNESCCTNEFVRFNDCKEKLTFTWMYTKLANLSNFRDADENKGWLLHVLVLKFTDVHLFIKTMLECV